MKNRILISKEYISGHELLQSNEKKLLHSVKHSYQKIIGKSIGETKQGD